MRSVREPAVAGMFYPDSPAKLKKDIQLLLENNKPSEKYDNVFGLVSPHAGYIYSGMTAAFAYNTLKDKKIKTAVIISPSHREYFPGISVFEGDAYKTPLGIVPVNKEMRSALTADENFIFNGINGHKNEHAVEVQIPFLQVVLDDFFIVPVVIGDQRKIFVEGLAEKLSQVVDEETVIVASSDLSHFHPKEKAAALDAIVERRIKDFDYENLQSDLENNRCEACGGGGIVALLKTADMMHKKNVKILSHTDSGDVTGDGSEVVGYLSAVVYG